MNKGILKKMVVFLCCILFIIVFFLGIDQAKDVSHGEMHISTFQVRRMDIYDTINVIGCVNPEEKQAVVLPQRGMIIDRVVVRKGDYVEKGDIICTLSIENITNRINFLNNIKNLDYSRQQLDFMEEYTDLGEEQIKFERDKLVKLKEAPFIVADSEGIILDVYVEEGKTSEDLLIADIGKGKMITAYASDDQVLEIETGMETKIYTVSQKDSFIEGKVKDIIALKQERGYEINIESYSDENLYLGATVGVQVIKEMRKNILAVPYDMISYDEKGSYVMYEDGNKEYIKLGLKTDYYFEIISKRLKENDVISMKFSD